MHYVEWDVASDLIGQVGRVNTVKLTKMCVCLWLDVINFNSFQIKGVIRVYELPNKSFAVFSFLFGSRGRLPENVTSRMRLRESYPFTAVTFVAVLGTTP